MSTEKVRVLVLRTAGTNCDYETKYAFELVGAEVELVHVNELKRGEKRLDAYQILAIPGGFTYGDDVASGKILANELRYKLGEEIRSFIDEGRLLIGICNGFQILVKAGLLPGMDGMPNKSACRDFGMGKGLEATLTLNDSAKFEDRWVYLRTVNSGQLTVNSKCIWTRGIDEIIYLPVAHAEGKFIPRDEILLKRLKENGQIVFQYVDVQGNLAGYPWNPNGSVENIAGICDSSGRILGMMPHPERHVTSTHHPRWTREGRKQEGDGLAIFRNGVEYARRCL